MSDRRTFLRGLISLPLIGGGVTLIGAPAAPVPLVQAAAMPAFAGPADRARYAWEAFSCAMREATSGADGWCILGAAERFRALPHVPAASFLRVASLHYVEEHHPRMRGPIIVERHRELELHDLKTDANTHWGA